jgi:hypothetical protein
MQSDTIVLTTPERVKIPITGVSSRDTSRIANVTDMVRKDLLARLESIAAEVRAEHGLRNDEVSSEYEVEIALNELVTPTMRILEDNSVTRTLGMAELVATATATLVITQ